MYCEHFGLQQGPFKITPDPRLFYEGSNRGAVLQALKYTILNGEGIVKVVGEVGSGKTMLCRMLEETLPDNVEIVYLDNPGLSPENILHAIAIEMKLPVNMQDNRFDVMKQLQSHLLDKHTANKQVVVFVEEAQGMPIETLEEIRLLSNLETQRHKLLQIVLFGQPELDVNLSQQRIRQLRDRITHRFSLEPLDTPDIMAYLMSRMRAVGYRGPDVFTRGAINSIRRASKGLMRRINILADKSLLAAFAESSHLVSRRHVLKAINDSEFSGFMLPSWAVAGASALAVCGLLLTTYLFVSKEIIAEPAAQVRLSPVDSFTEVPPSTVKKVTLDKLAPENIINERFLKTRHWLAGADKDHYSIQVLQTRADFKKELERFLRKQSVGDVIEKLYIYQTKINGRLMYCVMYDEFTSYADALKALASMPPGLKDNKPFLRSIYQLRDEAMEYEIS